MAGTLATQDCQLVAERNDFELQFHAAAKPTSEPGEDRRNVSKQAGDSTARLDKSLDFSTISEFLVGTGGSDKRPADPPKITLDDLIMHPERADNIADDQVRDVLREIAERTSALGTLQSQIMWRLVSLRNISAEGLPPLMNAKKLAEHLAVPEFWIREQARIGELPSIKLGHYVRFRLDDVQRHISRLAGSHVNAGVGADVSVPGSAASMRSRQVQRPGRRPHQHE
jgi:hypothetical protein